MLLGVILIEVILPLVACSYMLWLSSSPADVSTVKGREGCVVSGFVRAFVI